MLLMLISVHNLLNSCYLILCLDTKPYQFPLKNSCINLDIHIRPQRCLFGKYPTASFLDNNPVVSAVVNSAMLLKFQPYSVKKKLTEFPGSKLHCRNNVTCLLNFAIQDWIVSVHSMICFLHVATLYISAVVNALTFLWFCC